MSANITFVDENDKVIGAGTIKEARQKGIIHRVSRIFLFNSKGELLIQKRAARLTTSPGKWDQSAAGHVDEEEDYATAAKRELAEELGVENVALKEYGKSYSDETDDTDTVKKRFSMLYTGNYDGEVKPNAHEVSEVRWINPDELDTWMNERPTEFVASFIKNFRHLRNVKD